MKIRAFTLLMVTAQVACVSQPRSGADGRRSPAGAETHPFDGSYGLTAYRCGIERDVTQVKADMFALRQAAKARGASEIETGHSRVTAAAGSTLIIASGRFTLTLKSQCVTAGEIEERGDEATLRDVTSCAGKTVITSTLPEPNISRINFEGDYLVESTPNRCADGRDLQRIWTPSPRHDSTSS